MRVLLLRSLRERFRRTVMTSLAVVIGVALISGTLIFTDTISRSFDEIGEVSYRGVAVAVTPAVPLGTPSSEGSDDDRGLRRDAVDRVAGARGVRLAVGQLEGRAIVYRRDGRTPVGSNGPPTRLLSTLPPGVGGVRYTAGRAPAADDEVAIDADTAERAGVRVGDRVSVQGEGPRRRLRLVGLAGLGDGTTFGPRPTVLATQATAASILRRTPDRYWSQVLALSASGTRDEQVAADVRRVVGDGATVRTGEDQGARQAKEIKDRISFLPTILLVFAGIATFVGAFLIFNTFTITMAQRQREFALLRALGAARGQIRAMVAAETTTVGLLGATLGLLAGFGVAPGLRAVIKALGVDLPTTATVFSGRTIVVGFVVGMAVTAAAGLLPARRATRVAPVEALRDAAAPPGRGRVPRGPVLAGLAIGVVGSVALALALVGSVEGDTGTAFAGGGAGLLFLAATLISPVLVGPVARMLGRPLRRIFGLPGRLAQDNASRQPGRTAITSSALMIGLALVVFATVFAAGLRETLRGDIERVVAAPVVVQASGGSFSGVPTSVVGAVRRAPGVTSAGGVGFSRVAVGGRRASLTIFDAEALRTGLVRLQRTDGGGTAGDPGPGGAYVTDTVAGDLGARAGRTVLARGTNGEQHPLRIVGIVKGSASAVSGVVVNGATAATFGTTQPFFVVVDGRPDAVRRALARDYPATEVLTRSAWITDQTGQVNQLLGLVYALLGLSVLVALFGIVNTLSLSIQERIRELGLLRAVGATRAQVRRMVLLEAAITALLGALLGAALGFVLAAAVGATLDGFALSIPVGQIALLVALTGVLGVVAAIRPARRAARVEVLDAIAGE
ncbi:ABC transporter permease [Patulibacter minatonensis]|uniref:ABC transporter permease n=1 Tax=Patulibacter minatonensis TaxID=298163 RepID=UPI00047B4787|nr:ABC transporter permease [Patulibacter minatonensis]